jgi:hypothetical protein
VLLARRESTTGLRHFFVRPVQDAFPPTRHPGYNLGMGFFDSRRRHFYDSDWDRFEYHWTDAQVAVLIVTGAIFAAICLWLAVRLINRRERWAKWTLVALLGVPALYLASFGPACWWLSVDPSKTRADRFYFDGQPCAPRIYWPVGWLSHYGPRPIGPAIDWYATRRWPVVMLSIDPDGRGWHSAKTHPAQSVFPGVPRPPWSR